MAPIPQRCYFSGIGTITAPHFWWASFGRRAAASHAIIESKWRGHRDADRAGAVPSRRRRSHSYSLLVAIDDLVLKHGPI